MMPLSMLTGRDWPGIPTDERILSADQKIEKEQQEKGVSASVADWVKPETAGYQATVDAHNLCMWYNGRAYNTWSLNNLGDERELRTSKRRFRKLLELARKGDLNNMFAVAVETNRTLEDGTLKVNIDFDLAPRNPEWTGLPPIWRGFKGLDVAVLESEKIRGAPGAVIGVPKGSNEEIATQGTQCPGGPPFLVETMLKWHGAETIKWFYAKNTSSQEEVKR